MNLYLNCDEKRTKINKNRLGLVLFLKKINPGYGDGSPCPVIGQLGFSDFVIDVEPDVRGRDDPDVRNVDSNAVGNLKIKSK